MPMAREAATRQAAASEVVHHLERGVRVGLVTDETRMEAGAGARQRARLLAFLARVLPTRSDRNASEERAA